jgi:hypothetical protein
MKFKFNWGVKIFTVYGLFVAFMIFMVSRTMKHDVNLVSKDYYAKELAFQGQIDKIANAKKLDEKLSYRITTDVVYIHIPGKNIENGEITFFRPSDPKMDFIFSVGTSETGDVSVPATSFKSGMYRMKVDWESNSESYYIEEIIVIP